MERNDQVGLGIDVVEIARMKAILSRSPSFTGKVFSEGERAYCDKTSSPETHYATRFAAKEAVLKALGTGFSRGIRPRDVEVKRTSKGRPYVALHGRAKEVAAEMGVRELPISLSYTHTEAVACAMAITEDSVRAAEERADPMAELAQKFKDARAMLDDIDKPDKGTEVLSDPDKGTGVPSDFSRVAGGAAAMADVSAGGSRDDSASADVAAGGVQDGGASASGAEAGDAR